MLGALGVAALVFYLYPRVDAEIRDRIRDQIARSYPGLAVTVESADLVEGVGFEVRGISVSEPGAEGPCPELIAIDEMLLECPTDWQELMSEEPRVSRVVIRRPTLRVTRRPDGSWSVDRLLPLPRFNARPPEVRVEGATVEIFDPLRSPAGTLILRDVDMTMSPADDGQLVGPGAHTRKFEAAFTADHVRLVSVKGVVDLTRQSWSIGGTVEGLEVSPELRATLPGPLADPLAALRSARGQADFIFQVTCDPVAEVPLAYQLSGRLSRGRINDPEVPYALSDARCEFRLDNRGFAVENFSARSGQASVRLSCRRDGPDWKSPLRIEAEVRQLELDRQLLSALPESLKDQWYKYRPSGLVEADAKLVYDGKRWYPELVVRCLNVSFTYDRFPYRVDEGKGTVTLRDDVLRLNLTAQAGGQPVRLDGEWAHPGATPVGWLEAKGDQLPVDDKLLAAVGEGQRELIRSLNPRGAVDFYVRLWRNAADDPMHTHLVLGAKQCAVQYDRFPYPMRDIRGRIEMIDGSWTFSNIEGRNDTGRFTCQGQLTPTLRGPELSLRILGADVPLDEELRDALRPNEQQVWHAFRPRGSVDLQADVYYLAEERELHVSVRAEPQSQTTSIEPIHFPYRLEKLRGVLWYRDGHVTLEDFKAEHAEVKLSAGGSCDFLPDGQWRLRLENLFVDRLRLDRELVQALPERLRKMLVELKPGGPVNVRGGFELRRGPGPSEPIQSSWDLQLGLHQADLDCGIRLENIYGGLSLRGGFDGRSFRSRGELAIDSASYREFQVTELRGPIWIDDQQVLLGRWVARREQPPGPGGQASAARPVTGRLIGGTLAADAWVRLGPEPRYGVQAELAEGQLSRYAQESMPGRQNLRGTIFASLNLGGTGRTANALGGQGLIRLRDADIYELPLMISLLKIFSLRAPDPNAFSTADVDFRIEGEHFYFDRIDFRGDAISLLGKGEMDFQRNINLAFRAAIGRGQLNVPVIKEVFTGASQQIMSIHVDGTLDNPNPPRREAFPAVNQAIQMLQDDRQRDTGPAGEGRPRYSTLGSERTIRQ